MCCITWKLDKDRFLVANLSIRDYLQLRREVSRFSELNGTKGIKRLAEKRSRKTEILIEFFEKKNLWSFWLSRRFRRFLRVYIQCIQRSWTTPDRYISLEMKLRYRSQLRAARNEQETKKAEREGPQWWQWFCRHIAVEVVVVVVEFSSSHFSFMFLLPLLFIPCPVSRAIIRVTVFTQEATKLPLPSSWNVATLFHLPLE